MRWLPRTDSGIDADAPILNVTRFLERLGFGVVSVRSVRMATWQTA